jgi:hypothetical protein
VQVEISTSDLELRYLTLANERDKLLKILLARTCFRISVSGADDDSHDRGTAGGSRRYCQSHLRKVVLDHSRSWNHCPLRIIGPGNHSSDSVQANLSSENFSFSVA